MPSLHSAAALAALVFVAGVTGVVTADRTDVSSAALDQPAAVTDGPNNVTAIAPERGGGGTFEERLEARLEQFDLTDAQVRSIVSDAVRLRDDGASRLVIRSSVVMNLYDYGVDVPFLSADRGLPAGDRIAHRVGERFDLTDQQVAEIASTIDRKRADGATRVEIYRAVETLLVDYGVDGDEIDAAIRRSLHHRAHKLDKRADRIEDRAHRLHHLAHRVGDDRGGNRSTDG